MNHPEQEHVVLAGDIGGTKTNMALYSPGRKRPRLKAVESYSSRDAQGLDDIVERFLHTHPAPVFSICFGIAGPVINGECRTTNLPWHVSEKVLRRRFGWDRFRLINDLTATAVALPLLEAREFHSVNRAVSRKDGNLGLVAPGTGLGQALLVFHGGQYIPVPSEGGHSDFCPRNEDQVKLWSHLHGSLGHVSIERVLSGPGLVRIYEWLRDSGRYKEPGRLSREMEKYDPAAVITGNALKRGNPLCSAALDMFVSILGAVSGNLALTGMTQGGMYLGGGIPPKILSRLDQGLFMKAFTDKGRFRELLEKVPVRVILNDRAALLGAAASALGLLRKTAGP